MKIVIVTANRWMIIYITPTTKYIPDAIKHIVPTLVPVISKFDTTMEAMNILNTPLPKSCYINLKYVTKKSFFNSAIINIMPKILVNLLNYRN